MESTELINALKKAIKDEEKSAELYKQIADDTTNIAVNKLFNRLQKEEIIHYEYLIKLYQRYTNTIHLKEFMYEIKYFQKPSKEIFTADFLNSIKSNESIIMTLKTAANLEKNAIQFYKKCKTFTKDQEVIDFFHQMMLWEKNHLDFVLTIFESLDEPEFVEDSVTF